MPKTIIGYLVGLGILVFSGLYAYLMHLGGIAL